MTSIMRHAAFAGAVALLAAGAAQAKPGDPLKVKLVDVEGGGATLFVTPEGKSVLLDAGWPDGEGRQPGDRPAPETSAQRIAAAAKSLGVSKIDYLVVTHYHLDHIGGVPAMLRAMPVGTLVDHGTNREPTTNAAPGTPAYASSAVGLLQSYEIAAKGHKRLVVKAGDKLQVGSLRLDFVNADAKPMAGTLPGGGGTTPGCPGSAPAANGENPASIGIVASFGKARVLSLADTTADVELSLVCPTNKLGRIDLLVVSHHGSSLSTTPQLIAATMPRVALMGNGARKGGDKQVFDILTSANPKPALWQQHAATRSPEVDGPADRIANLAGETDAGHSLDAWLWTDGRMRIVNGRTGAATDFPAN